MCGVVRIGFVWFLGEGVVCKDCSGGFLLWECKECVRNPPGMNERGWVCVERVERKSQTLIFSMNVVNQRERKEEMDELKPREGVKYNRPSFSRG